MAWGRARLFVEIEFQYNPLYKDAYEAAQDALRGGECEIKCVDTDYVTKIEDDEQDPMDAAKERE